jgi:hypothetical protein
MSRCLADRVSRTPRVQIWRNCEVSELVGSATLAAVVGRDLLNGEERPLEATALLVLIGSLPHTTWFQGQIPLDDTGFVRTGLAREPAAGMFEPGRRGVFAVGDVRSGSVKRVASVVGRLRSPYTKCTTSSLLPDDADKCCSPLTQALIPILPVRVSGGPNRFVALQTRPESSAQRCEGAGEPHQLHVVANSNRMPDALLEQL